MEARPPLALDDKPASWDESDARTDESVTVASSPLREDWMAPMELVRPAASEEAAPAMELATAPAEEMAALASAEMEARADEAPAVTEFSSEEAAPMALVTALEMEARTPVGSAEVVAWACGGNDQSNLARTREERDMNIRQPARRKQGRRRSTAS